MVDALRLFTYLAEYNTKKIKKSFTKHQKTDSEMHISRF